MRAVITEKDVAKIRAKAQTAQDRQTAQELEQTAQELEKKVDDYVSQLVKFIPAEVVTFYTAIFVSASSVAAEIPYQNVTWIMFGMGLIATFVFSLSNNKKELKTDEFDVSGQVKKTILSTIAFVIWAFTLGPPFKDALSGYHPFYGTLLMTFYTLIAPRIYSLIP